MGTGSTEFDKGMTALSQADFDSAIELFSRTVVEEPENSRAWTQLGLCYLETRQLELALEALQRAVKADPDNAAGHYLLGTALGSFGNLDRAAECYRKALALDPGHAKAEEFLMKTEALLASREHYRKGLALLATDSPPAPQLNQAVRELIQSVALFDQSPARDHLAECAQRLLEAKREQPLAIPVNSQNHLWAAACERGWQCVRFGNWVGARAAYDGALAYRWQDAFVHHALGFSFIKMGDPDEAVRAWLRVLELDADYDFRAFGRIAGEEGER